MRKTVQRDPVTVQNARRCRVERPGLASQPTCQWRRDMPAHNLDVHRSIHRSIARILRWVATPHHPAVAFSYPMVYNINRPGMAFIWFTRFTTRRLISTCESASPATGSESLSYGSLFAMEPGRMLLARLATRRLSLRRRHRADAPAGGAECVRRCRDPVAVKTPDGVRSGTGTCTAADCVQIGSGSGFKLTQLGGFDLSRVFRESPAGALGAPI